MSRRAREEDLHIGIGVAAGFQEIKISFWNTAVKCGDRHVVFNTFARALDGLLVIASGQAFVFQFHQLIRSISNSTAKTGQRDQPVICQFIVNIVSDIRILEDARLKLLDYRIWQLGIFRGNAVSLGKRRSMVHARFIQRESVEDLEIMDRVIRMGVDVIIVVFIQTFVFSKLSFIVGHAGIGSERVLKRGWDGEVGQTGVNSLIAAEILGFWVAPVYNVVIFVPLCVYLIPALNHFPIFPGAAAASSPESVALEIVAQPVGCERIDDRVVVEESGIGQGGHLELGREILPVDNVRIAVHACVIRGGRWILPAQI